MTRRYQYAVVGGGIIGASIAWGLARKGAAVALIDGSDRDFRASVGNFGLLWIQGKGASYPAYATLSQKSGKLWKEFVTALEARSNIETGFIQKGGFTVFLSETERDAYRAKIDGMSFADESDRPRIIDGRELNEMLPQTADVVGACYGPRDGTINPLALLKALYRALALDGCDLHFASPVSRIDHAGGEFNIRASSGRLLADKVVVSAGLDTKRLAAQLGMAIDIRPQRGQIIVTERARVKLAYPTSSIRQMPEGTLLIGSTQDYVGHNKRVEIDSVSKTAGRAVRVMPFIKDVNIARIWGCLRIVTPDGAPIYEQSSEFPGAFAVTAHSGVTLAAIHALELADAIVAGHLPPSMSGLPAHRFSMSAKAGTVDSH
jgi:glycine/D-amino acid oxidase-like deaminating enzyme